MQESQALAFSGETDCAAMQRRYLAVRQQTEDLVAELSPEDCLAQSMPDASPAKWHLAHVTWYFETFLLESWSPDYVPLDRDYRVLFNSYYNAVGEQHPRPRRGLLTRPTLAQVFAYRQYVDEAMATLIERGLVGDPERAALFELGLHHEQQHQELLLMDVKHLFSCNPLAPAYHQAPAALPAPDPGPLRWRAFEGGIGLFGAPAEGFSFDNERPRHQALLQPYELASRPVTNGEFLAFIADGGYEQPGLWLADGWAAVQQAGWRHPRYWRERDGQWLEFTLAGLQPLDPHAPACHLSYFEADAYASWAGARLPDEREWEAAAASAPVAGNFLESGHLQPRAAAPAAGLQQLFGDVWEWTRSSYSPYPGFRPPAGAVGEYNGKFMSGQYVLRGGACVTPQSHARLHYRNFYYPDTHWHFSGLRLARDTG